MYGDLVKTFEELIASYILASDELIEEKKNKEYEELILDLREILYFVRNLQDVMTLNLRDEDFRRIVTTFYNDMEKEIMKDKESEEI